MKEIFDFGDFFPPGRPFQAAIEKVVDQRFQVSGVAVGPHQFVASNVYDETRMTAMLIYTEVFSVIRFLPDGSLRYGSVLTGEAGTTHHARDSYFPEHASVISRLVLQAVIAHLRAMIKSVKFELDFSTHRYYAENLYKHKSVSDDWSWSSSEADPYAGVIKIKALPFPWEIEFDCRYSLISVRKIDSSDEGPNVIFIGDNGQEIFDR